MPLKPEDLEIIKKLDMKSPYVWLATWFGSGFLRPGPGTWGSAVSIPFAIIIFNLGGVYALLAAILIITPVGFWASAEFEKATDSHDNKMIVIDEAAGQWITLLPTLYYFGPYPLWILAAFIVFRVLDIFKPWPVSYFDRMKGARGVMLDDIAAGLIGAVIITGLYYGFA